MGLGCAEIRNLKCWVDCGAQPLLTEDEILLGVGDWPTSASHQAADGTTTELNPDPPKG